MDFCLLSAGLIAIGGSGGDCDGKCMEYANSMGEMMIAVYWVDIVVTGGNDL